MRHNLKIAFSGLYIRGLDVRCKERHGLATILNFVLNFVGGKLKVRLTLWFYCGKERASGGL